jgi:hypothetical protein
MGRLAPFWVGPVLTGLICVAASAQSGSDVDRTRRSAEVPSLPQEAPPSSPPVPVLPPLPPPPSRAPERLPLEVEHQSADPRARDPGQRRVGAAPGGHVHRSVSDPAPVRSVLGSSLKPRRHPRGNLQDYGLPLQLVVAAF